MLRLWPPLRIWKFWFRSDALYSALTSCTVMIGRIALLWKNKSPPEYNSRWQSSNFGQKCGYHEASFASSWNVSPNHYQFSSVSSVAQLWLTLCDPMNHSTPGLPVHHQLPECKLMSNHYNPRMLSWAVTLFLITANSVCCVKA